MEIKELIEEIRIATGDVDAPYTFSDNQLEQMAAEAVSIYSRYRPAVKTGQIEVIPGKEEYSLEGDYQMWIEGLEECEVVGVRVFIRGNRAAYRILYKYYADRDVTEIPDIDIPLIIDYCTACAIEHSVIRRGGIKSGDENIAALRLGKGLDISFDTAETLKKEITAIAARKKDSFINELKNRLMGSWC